MNWVLKSWQSDSGFDKKARNLMISDKKEQFSYRNWCNFIVKNIQKMRHFRRNLVCTLRFKHLPFRQRLFEKNGEFLIKMTWTHVISKGFTK